jgi:hypothetical protein
MYWPLCYPSLRRQILDADILHAPLSEKGQGDIKQLAPAGFGVQQEGPSLPSFLEK